MPTLVRILQVCSDDGRSYVPGETPTVRQHVARDWVARGIAEEIGEGRARVETAAIEPPETAAAAKASKKKA